MAAVAPQRRGRHSTLSGLLLNCLPSHRPTIPDLSLSNNNNGSRSSKGRKRIFYYYLLVASVFVLTSISMIIFPNNDSVGSRLQLVQYPTSLDDHNNNNQGMMMMIQTTEMEQSMNKKNSTIVMNNDHIQPPTPIKRNNINTTSKYPNNDIARNEFVETSVSEKLPSPIAPAAPSINKNNNNNNTQKIKKNLKLRFDWTDLQPTLELTKLYKQHQNNCSLPLGDFLYRNEYGMGSDLHMWGRSLCNGLTTGHRIRTVGNWTWFDQEGCSNITATEYSPMLCYFPKSELQCPKQDYDYVEKHPNFDPNHKLSQANGRIRNVCRSVLNDKYSIPDQNLAGLEFLFLNISPLVVKEAGRQVNLIFGDNGEIPKDLITVHIRWGDKGVEMRLVTIQSYIQAIHKILDQRGVASNHDHASIFLATEDPKAVKAFREAMPSTWNLYLDQFYVDMLPHRIKGYNGNPKMSLQTKGKAGLVTLASLLVAMESNDFVLTTASNWSRMMNELRLAIVDPRCGGCTSAIDLRKPSKNIEQ